VWALIRELAIFERAPEQHEVTPEELVQHFQQGLFDALVAEKDNKIVGLSLYYWRYSTWKGKRLYLEDLIVKEAERGQGIGKALFDATLQISLDENCSGLMWQVLDWNEPAIEFYRKHQASLDGEWINCSLESGQVRDLLANKVESNTE
jgi:GNAT superfamily N-acetyltransferase